jgi:anti-anti-sigma factor
MSASNEAVRVDPQGRVVITGDIDVLSASPIEAVLRQLEEQLGTATAPVVIDVGKVAFIDSSGLRVLLAASRRNGLVGRRVVLMSPGATIDRLLGITGTTQMFDLARD